MSSPSTPFDVSKELASLRHKKKNKTLHRLPQGTTIQRRPLNHAAVASPHAGANVPKVVYVSARTPLMSAVKRVKKLLHHIEKRATQSVSLTKQGEKTSMKRLAEASETISKQKEAVLVKASGRAMVQALKVAEWFRNKEDEMACEVELKTGSVSAVDDIVEIEEDKTDNDDGDDNAVDRSNVNVEQEKEQEREVNEDEETTLEGGDTTLKLLGETTTATATTAVQPLSAVAESNKENNTVSTADKDSADEPSSKKKRRRKRKRPIYDKDDLPEARIRWIKTVEVAITLKG